MDYDSQVRRRFLAAQRAGPLDAGTPGLASGEAEDRILNVWVRFQLQVLEGVIRAVRYNIFGCPHAVAAADWTAAWLEGKPVKALDELSMRDCLDTLGIPVEKLGKLLLMEDALASCRRELVERREPDDRREPNDRREPDGRPEPDGSG